MDGIIDAQGFSIDLHFYPVELSVVGKNFEFHFSILNKLNFHNLSHSNQKTVRYVTRNIHGLILNSTRQHNYPFLCNCCTIQQLVARVCQEIRMKNGIENVTLGIQNPQLQSELVNLKQMDLIDLQNIAPTFQTLFNAEYIVPNETLFCKLHTKIPTQNKLDFKCSLGKSKLLWKWANTSCV
jgi:hypothetical protein